MATNKIKIYGFWGFLRLVRDKIFTILFFSNSRIIRLPVYIRGKKGIIGAKNLTTGVNLRIDIINSDVDTPKLIIGDNVEFNDYVHIGVAKKVIIGDNTLIASKVFIADHNHGSYRGDNQSHPKSSPISRVLVSKEIVIGENVWIGEHVSILPGVTIGNGSIIGAMSVVTNNIPENSIAVGAPARVIKTYDETRCQWVSI